ncbi:hypothetical protein NESM_000282600 [Novymonas esmeraldas]|uniref:Uncharacterized protein n=1 Tax=Novymonas esmeraldas TaxID=1808958 RepID=A0AAW0F839_9TRYP
MSTGPAKSANRAATPAVKGPAVGGAAKPPPRAASNDAHVTTTPSSTARPTSGTAVTAATPSTQRTGVPPVRPAVNTSVATPSTVAGAKSTPGSVAGAPAAATNGPPAPHQQVGSHYGAGSMMGGFGAGMPNSTYGAGNAYGGGSMLGGFAPPGADGSMYGGQNPSMMYNSGYGPAMMGAMGGANGMGSMYGSGVGGGAGGGGMMGSMYGGMGSMGSMGSMGGMGGGYGMSGYGVNGFGGSLYGGSLLGSTGSLYGTGGSLYGSNDPKAVMSSMYGSRVGSMFGGFGSIYQVGGPHTDLGVVRKQSIPGFSYAFGSNLGTSAYNRSFNAASAESSTRGAGYRENSFRTSTSMQASEYPPSSAPGGAEAKSQSAERGTTGMDKDGKPVADTEKEKTKTAPAAVVETASRESTSKPTSIMKRQAPVTEAPKSPATLRQTRSGSGADTAAPTAALSTDYRIHNVVVLDVADGSRDAASAKKKGDACVVKGRSYAVDEVVESGPGSRQAIAEARHLKDLIEHMLAGHNVALLVADDGTATAASVAAVEATVTRLTEELKKPSRNGYVGLSMSMCSLPTSATVRDLLHGDEAAAAATPMKGGNSPLFGPTVMGLKSEPIEDGAAFTKHYAAALKRGSTESLMVCMLVVKQTRATAASDGKGEVFLSSLFIGISRAGPKGFHALVDKSPAAAHELFRYAVGGPTVAVHVVAVSQNATDGAVLEDAAKVGAVQNSAPRSGNVRRFVDFTEEQLKSMLKRRDASSGAERVELDNHVKRLSVVLHDAKQLLADPKSTVPHVYPTESERSTETTPAEPKSRAVAAEVSPSSTAAKQTTAASAATVAPPTAAAAAAAATASAADDKPRSTNVATLVVADAAEARAYSVAGTTVTAGGRPFAVDEVVVRDGAAAAAPIESAVTTSRVLAAFHKGYNGAIITVDSAAVAANGMESPSMSLVTTAVTGALALPGCKGVRVSIALVRESGVACDLTGTTAELKPIEVSSSPLFGPVVHNAALHRVRNTEELQRLVDGARTLVKPIWDAQSAVYVTVVHCCTDGDDVCVSSLLLSFASAAGTLYDQVLQQQAHLMQDLFRYAFGGAATTAVVVSLSKTDQVAGVVAALNTQHTAGAVRNRSPRQGSISNFIAYTKASLEKRRERLASLADDSAEKAPMLKLMAPMERMLADHEKVMEDPSTHFPRAYAADSSIRSASGKAANGEPPAAAKQGGDAQGEQPPAKATTTTATSTTTTTTATAATAAAPGAQSEDPSAAFTEPRVVVFLEREAGAGEKQLSLGSKDYTVDEMVRRTKTSSGTATGPSQTLSDVEALFAGVHNCSLVSASSVTRATSSEEPVWMYFQQCLNNALAGGKPGEEVRVDLTFTIVSADELVTDLLLDAAKAPARPLEIVSSPIYGPRVENASTAAAQSADELGRVMDKVHDRAVRHLAALRAGALMMVGTALLRRRTSEGDVLVASLLGTLTGPSAQAYKEAAEKAPVARRALLSSAFGGPSATVTLVNLGAEDETAQGMVATAIAISKKQRNLVSRSGSVQAFVKYTESTMKREQARAGTATGEARERHLQKVKRLQPVVEDHERLLRDFAAPIPAYPVTRGHSGSTPQAREDGGGAAAAAAGTPGTASARTPQTAAASAAAATPNRTPTAVAAGAAQTAGSPRPSQHVDARSATGTPANGVKKEPAAPNRIQGVVVLTAARETPSSASAAVPVTRTDETHVTALIAGAARVVECDEAVSRLDSSSPVRAEQVNAAAQQFVSGFNAALLCCDAAGSNAGPTACSKAVHHAIEAKPEASELYMSITVVRGEGEGEVRDMLAASGEAYAPMKVSNSPIFGPWVHQATMARLADVAQFDKAFSTAHAEATKEAAVCVVHLVLKTMEKKDVVVSSLLISLSARLDAYAGVVNVPPKTDRKLYQYAIQGSCFTVGLLGLTEKVKEAGLAEGLNVFAGLRAIENRPMRNGSVRRFLAYSVSAAADVKSRAERVTDARQKSVYEQRLASLEKMVADARGLIDAPEGQIPRTYV